MKKIFFLSLLVGVICLATKAQSWTAWQSFDCMSGLDYRTKSSSEYSSSGKKTVYVDFRNRYRETIWFSWTVREMGSSKPTTNRTQLRAGATDGENFGAQIPTYATGQVHVDGVSFQDGGGRPYADCD